MAAQLKDKGHPALQKVRSEKFAMVIDTCHQAPAPTPALLKLVQAGRLSLRKR